MTITPYTNDIAVCGLILQQGYTVPECVVGHITVGQTGYSAALAAAAHTVGNGTCINHGCLSGT